MDPIAGVGLIVAVLGTLAAIFQLVIGIAEWKTKRKKQIAPHDLTSPVVASETKPSGAQKLLADASPQLVMLPRRPEPFINRDREIERIENALKSLKVVQLRGLGGIGKTELAIEAAYRLQNFFPDGVIHLDALVYSTLEDILNAIANAFDIQVAQMPLNEKKSVIRKRLLSKTLLLIFDNVESVQPINDILNILSKSAVLITSRPSYIISKADLIDVGPMPQEHAISLFEVNSGQQLSDLERNLTAGICRQLGAFPLAIELAAKQVRISKVNIRSLAERIGKTTTLETIEPKHIDDRSVRASFNSTYQLLSDDDQKLFLILGTFGGRSFGLAAVKAISGNDQAEEAMDRLTALSLVKVDDNRYSLHPLLKLFAREKLEDRESYQRMAEYYAAYAVDHTNDYDLLEIERANLQEAVNWSSRNNAEHLVIKIVQALLGEEPEYGFLAQRGYWNDALIRIQQAIQASAKLSDVLLEARFNLSLGLFNYWMGKNNEARARYSLAQQRFEAVGDSEGLIHVCWQRGYIEDDEDNYAKADQLYRQSLSLSLKTGDMNLICRSRELVGVVEYHRGNLKEAREHLEQSLKESVSLGNKGRIARTQRRLAAVARKQAENYPHPQSQALVEESRRLLEEALKIESNERSVGRLLRQSGMLEQLVENYPKAKEYYTQSLNIFNKLGNSKGVAATLYNLGTVAAREGKLSEAEEFYNKSLAIGKEINVRSGVALNLLGLASVAHRQGDCNKSLQLASEAVHIFTSIESPHLSSARRVLDQIHVDCGSVKATPEE